MTLTDEQAAQFREKKLRVNVITARFPRGEIGSPLIPDDSDQDGIPDYVNTYLTEMFPCDGPWKNHGDYVNAVSKLAGQLVASGELTIQQYSQIVRQAQHSDCGMVFQIFLSVRGCQRFVRALSEIATLTEGPSLLVCQRCQRCQRL